MEPQRKPGDEPVMGQENTMICSVSQLIKKSIEVLSQELADRLSMSLPISLTRDRKQFLLWRFEPDPGGKKPRKIPYYTSGHRRNGTQGSPEDRAQLATFTDALRVLENGGYDGVGIAMLPEANLVGVDLDHCVDDGKVKPEFAPLFAGTYAEISPSGTGVRGFYRGSYDDRKHLEKGVEILCGKGFLTLTGDRIKANPIIPMPSHIKAEFDRIFSEQRAKTSALNPLIEAGATDPVFCRLKARGMIRKDCGGGKYLVECPNAAAHTTGGGDGDCAYYLPHTGGYERGAFHCLHAHCAELPQAEFRRLIGIENGCERGTTVAGIVEIAVAPPEDWPKPLPLSPDDKAEPYPLEALPGMIGEAVGEVTRFVQCPVALTACCAMAAVSTVAAGLADVKRAGKLSGPIGLYFLALADSGERKTTVDGFFTKVIRQWELEQEEARRPEVQSWRAADAAWTAERDGVLLAIKEASKRGKPVAELKNTLADLEARKPERPRVPQLLIGDATSEALTWRLANKWPVGGLSSSEAGVVFGGHAMGRDSIMRNLGALNCLWDALPLSVDRRTSESFTVRSARLTAGLAAQPGTIRQWIENCRGLARESGFLARFLLAWPESTQGRRRFQEAPEHWPALSRFHRRLADLLNTPIRFDDFGQLAPVVLELDLAAKAVWIGFHDAVEAELAPGGDMAEARDVASKAGDNAARMAALFHVFENGPAGTIGADHMQRAARIVAWHLYEAKRFLNQIAVPESVADAVALGTWMVDYCRRERLTVIPRNTILQFGPNRTRRKKALEAALSELKDANRIRLTTDGRKAVVQLNPSILGGGHGPA